jgi:hypothetical protein
VTNFLRDAWPVDDARFEVRFEAAPGQQGQVDFAQFQVVFTDEPTTVLVAAHPIRVRLR